MSQIQLIDAHDFKTWTRVLAEGVLTLAMWAVGLYVFLPLMALAALVIGFEALFEYDPHILHELKGHISIIFTTFAAAIAIFVSWGYYNYMLYCRRERREKKARAALANRAPGRWDFDIGHGENRQVERKTANPKIHVIGSRSEKVQTRAGMGK